MRPLVNRVFTGALAAGAALTACLAAPARATPSIVVDVASGQILEQDQATAVWYPASVTKLMTVYVALDAVRQNRLTMDTPLVVSARAARMAPSKMGFRPGSEVTLRNALIMLMVKSANDVAVTIAEGVSGSVEAFADEMNKASATLGMRESHWVNPNGLPDDRHVTSARDLAMLARALLLQFPESAELYNVGAMQFAGQIVPNHNGMLGRYPGADGMKTGFTCPAGYNLVASATHGGQKLIAVVLGAPSPGARTAKAASLLDRAFQTGSPMGTPEALPGFGPGGTAPNMRDSVCRHRAKANEEFLAEVEDMSIPITAPPTGNAVVDALAGGQQHVSVKDLARLPRPQFQPVPVFAGRAPGYQGPVARARPAGVAIGADAEVAAYSSDKNEAAGASPISRAAPDAKPLRGHGRHGKAQLAKAAKAEPAAGAEEPEKTPQAKPPAGKSASGKGKAGAKTAAAKPAHHAEKPAAATAEKHAAKAKSKNAAKGHHAAAGAKGHDNAAAGNAEAGDAR
ncbi:D-alanyl-D-alanine carboxypeptidase family protein [Methylocystis heyeri]|uniref:D-alanyl-D-alanine carboxypeptidase n=1 Tax=Methylocystis heyeri TaxID=391905 RepID=A0A6B8KJ45_9HYPH|nr:D-alanyl-D-alanine carboxypeptidase family protein [Methylocystis heyeri]QGM47529.1 D-alanyl-D-alanine carboxypeptidase [Methylocystis heyeri]